MLFNFTIMLASPYVQHQQLHRHVI
jgi:hypothetical protein